MVKFCSPNDSQKSQHWGPLVKVGKVKGKVCTRAKWLIRSELILVSVARDKQEYFYSPLDGMLVHRRVTPSITFAGTHLYTWVERGTARVNCLAQEHNTMSPNRDQTWTATPPPLVKLNCSYSVMDSLLPKSANWNITS